MQPVVGFALESPFRLRGDQPEALARLESWFAAGHRFATLLGVTGSGKTFTMANLIARLQRPVLVITHNKTLSAQLYGEFADFFPRNAVEYFVSYYDYYQPEAYLPGRDLYIEKDSDINEEIDRFRHAATAAIFSRRDVLVVATVSCIYGLGSPEDYLGMHLILERGRVMPRQEVLAQLTEIQYSRNDLDFSRSRFRVRGETVDIFPAAAEDAIRVRFFGDEIELLERFDPRTGEVLDRPERIDVFPAQHYVTPEAKRELALASIEAELQERLAWFRANDRLVEAQRLYERTRFDLEMMRETGFCKGIENYSRHLAGRKAGEPPDTLVDYLPKDALIIIDESHVTVPQLRGMCHGDRSRKQTLIEYGFRLPSALDNRPLDFDEFLAHPNPILFVSATPAAWELEVSGDRVAEQLIRPTGLLDPEIEVRPTEGQMDRLLADIQARVDQGERVLITTMTKRMAQDLADWLDQMGVKASYLHADIDTLERVKILRDLRLGEFDVLVGINLLREGLDLPEVSLVAILDADKEGFLRSAWALMQTCGRAARNARGRVVLYADQITPAMQYCLDETRRRREIQAEFNRRHGIVPTTVVKAVPKLLAAYPTAGEQPGGGADAKGAAVAEEARQLVATLRDEMARAAAEFQYERAAQIRDEILALEETYFEARLEDQVHRALKQARDRGQARRALRTRGRGGGLPAGPAPAGRPTGPAKGRVAGAGRVAPGRKGERCRPD